MDEGPFHWDDLKATTNLQKHNVSFEEARAMLTGDGPLYERVDIREDYGEERLQIIGFGAGHRALFVVVVEGEEVDRIISARLASASERAVFERFLRGEF